MSLYFDGFFACDLKLDVPQRVVDTLKYMTREDEYEFADVPDHRFFTIEGWNNFLRPEKDAMGEVWTCAPGFVVSEFQKKTQYGPHNTNWEYYTLSFRRTMHDDVEFNVHWWDFLDWIAPYSDTTGYVGYYREEFTLHPKLIYLKNGRLFWVIVEGVPQGIEGGNWDEPSE
jgi:hypothetical protein